MILGFWPEVAVAPRSARVSPPRASRPGRSVPLPGLVRGTGSRLLRRGFRPCVHACPFEAGIALPWYRGWRRRPRRLIEHRRSAPAPSCSRSRDRHGASPPPRRTPSRLRGRDFLVNFIGDKAAGARASAPLFSRAYRFGARRPAASFAALTDLVLCPQAEWSAPRGQRDPFLRDPPVGVGHRASLAAVRPRDLWYYWDLARKKLLPAIYDLANRGLSIRLSR